MRAMRLEKVGTPLALRDLPDPEPGPLQVRIRVEACAVCAPTCMSLMANCQRGSGP
jgi:D-arabinose 1-dehydrogenase-like Zn-dependent alcohol dehydrogenase